MLRHAASVLTFRWLFEGVCGHVLLMCGAAGIGHDERGFRELSARDEREGSLIDAKNLRAAGDGDAKYMKEPPKRRCCFDR